MKTLNLFLKVIVGALMILTVAACSKDKKGSNNNLYNSGFYMQNGICINRSNGQQVDPTLCQTYGGGGAGQCNQAYPVACMGTYYSPLHGAQGTCGPQNPGNCAGLCLQNMQTGQWQFCNN